MSDYSRETCEGCLHFLLPCSDENPYYCLNHGKGTASDFLLTPSHCCDQFAPSLQCRQVRALERIASAVIVDKSESVSALMATTRILL